MARDTFPRLSPDGRWVAFTSDRFGNADVFIIPSTGGEPKQLTFSTAADTVLNWTPDGKGVLITTQSGISPWRSPLAIVPITSEQLRHQSRELRRRPRRVGRKLARR